MKMPGMTDTTVYIILGLFLTGVVVFAMMTGGFVG
jgi:hypothetical protein